MHPLLVFQPKDYLKKFELVEPLVYFLIHGWAPAFHIVCAEIDIHKS